MEKLEKSKLPNAYWIFKVDKECKHSRRFTALDDAAPVSSIYFKRDFREKLIEGIDEIAVSFKEVKKS